MAGLGLALTGPRLAWAETAGDGARFELFRQKIFLPMQVNGVAATGYLDTGASDLVIDPAFAAKAGLVGVRDVITTGWGQDGSAREADGAVLQIAGVQVTGTATLADISALQRSIGRPFDLFVGRTLFNAFVVEIDFDQQHLKITPREDFQPPLDATHLDMASSGRENALPITLEDQGPFLAGIDLGSSMPLAVTRDLARRIGLLDGRAMSSTVINSLGGASAHPVVTAGAFALGPFALPDIPAVVFDDLPRQAVLGLAVFTRFHLWLDLGRRRMWLRPGAQAGQLFDKDRVGLFTTVEDDGSFRVIHVAEGSPAEAAGFAEGQRLAGVNGRALTELRALDPPPPQAGMALSYQMADGSVRSLVTADYY
jgi:predicted aspartyl protease